MKLSALVAALRGCCRGARLGRTRIRACCGWRDARRAHGINLTIDAEEADRLDLSLELIDRWRARADARLDGLGLAVQAYQKRAPLVIDGVADLARDAAGG